jgi:hypothetical protein
VRYESGEHRPIPRNLEGLAQIARAEGGRERATQLFGAAETLREAQSVAINLPYLAEYERETAALRAEMGEEAFAAAWAEGRALRLEQAVKLAISNL